MANFRGIMVACSNPYYESAVTGIDGFSKAIAVHEQAVQRIDELNSKIPAINESGPLTAGKITDKWLDESVAARTKNNDIDVRRDILNQIRTIAEADLAALVEFSMDDILAHLQADLTELVTDAKDAVLTLGNARTATEAIIAGAHQSWAALAELAAQYAQLREAQMKVMNDRYELVEASRTRYHTDPTASDLVIANLDEVWPMWRKFDQYDTTSGQLVPNVEPWPDEPVALLIWLVTSNAEPWIPTTTELADLHASRNSMPSRIGNTLNAPGVINVEMSDRTKRGHKAKERLDKRIAQARAYQQ